MTRGEILDLHTEFISHSFLKQFTQPSDTQKVWAWAAQIYNMIREIRLYGDPVLTKSAETVPEITEEIRDILTDMWDTMEANRCVGLSAPQIGVSLRLFVINAGGVVIQGANPEVLTEGAPSEDIEGSPCIPGIQKPVRRPRKITVRYLDESGEIVERELKGVAARAYLHEKDHHEGVLFIDHLKPGVRKLIQKDLDRIAGNRA